MIIASDTELIVGKIYDETCHPQGNGTLYLKASDTHHKFKFMVLAVATHEQYLKELVEDGIKISQADLDVPPQYQRFYKVSMD